MHELLKVRTFHEAMPFLPEMQEVSRITPFLAPHRLDKETLKVWAILAVFRDSRRPRGCYDTYSTSQSGRQQLVLLMTCQVIAVGPDGIYLL